MAIRDLISKWERPESGESAGVIPDRGKLEKTGSAANPVGQDLLDLSFQAFTQSRRYLRLHSRVLGDEVYFVADETLIPTLPDPSLVVYTAVELHHLAEAFKRGFTADDLRLVHRSKKKFGLEIELFDGADPWPATMDRAQDFSMKTRDHKTERRRVG